MIQAACLLAYLGLLFYVCFPYTARPARSWSGWTPQEVDAQTGRAVVAGKGDGGAPIASGQTLHVVDAGASPPAPLGAFRVTQSAQGQLVLEPLGERSPKRLDQLAASFGPWTLQEDEPGAWPSHYVSDLKAKERIPAELFLALDPLVSLSTALASRAWVWSLPLAGLILLACLVVPRGFCGYVCPFGTLIDAFDWLVSRRVRKAPAGERRWWSKIKYGVLAAVAAAALCGVLLSGLVAAIPVLTRGLGFLLAPLQTGLVRGWHQVPPLHAGHVLSVAGFLAILTLGLIRPRFWCRYVCPTGAVFSAITPLRALQRKVGAGCTRCGKCVQACPFDAIDSSIATRTADCALCRTCGGVCPTHAIHYAPRWSETPSAPLQAVPHTRPTSSTTLPQPTLGRRGFLSSAAGVTLAAASGAGAASGVRAMGAHLNAPNAFHPVRPPGSLPEREFLQQCIRCGECFRACPNDALQPLGFQQGLEGLWTPRVAADWSGCEPSCANCGQVCPTGAIRALPLEEKRAARIGLAVVDRARCLPHAGVEDCRLCVDECKGAGYDAIEFLKIGTKLDANGSPIEESGFLAPVVLPEKCVGCGLCQTRCGAINAAEKRLLRESAIRVEAGDGRKDRLRAGSYVALRKQEAARRAGQRQNRSGQDEYLPDGL